MVEKCGGTTVAHLIKLEDYISRYQFDLQRYPNQFTRFKKERWYYLKSEWENTQGNHIKKNTPFLASNDIKNEKNNVMKKTLSKVKLLQPFFSWKKVEPEEEQENNVQQTSQAKSLDELKKQFLDELFESQLKWASSSLMEESYLNPRYKFDEHLKFFVQQLPDNYFLLYRPVFWIKQAPLDMQIILISPTDIYCIVTMEGQDNSIFGATSERFWIEYIHQKQKRIISPLLDLNRMSSTIHHILKEAEISMPVKKVVLANKGLIDNKMTGFNGEFIDKRNLQQWHEKMKRHSSPIKSQQLKVAKILLDHCHTSAYKRQTLDETEVEQ